MKFLLAIAGLGFVLALILVAPVNIKYGHPTPLIQPIPPKPTTIIGPHTVAPAPPMDDDPTEPPAKSTFTPIPGTIPGVVV